MLLDIRPDYLQIVRDILQKHVPQYEVWAFGSRAKWTAKEYSDLDLCIRSDKPLSFSVLGAIGDDFSNSDLPWKVDIVDWATTSASFRKIIERDKVLVQQPTNTSGWSELSVSDIAEITPSRNLKKGMANPFIEMAALSADSRDIPPAQITTRPFSGSGSRFMDGDVLLARITPCLENGKTALVSGLGKAVVGHGSTEFIVLAARDASEQRFIYYLARHPDFREYAIQHMEGTSGRQRVSAGAIGKYHFLCPPPPQRKEIGEVLGILDDKIALLRETNATLEAIAQALFKSWFVDFDPVRAKVEIREPAGIPPEIAALFPSEFENSELGEIPKGWTIQRAEDFSIKVGMGPFGSNIKVSTFVDKGIPIISGQHLHGTLMEDGSFNFITKEHAMRLSSSIVGSGDLVFTHAGNIGQVSLIPKACAFSEYVLSQRQFYLRCNREKMLPTWAVYFFRSRQGQHLLLANASQVGVPSIARPVSYLKSIRLVTPPMTLLQLFNDIVEELHAKQMACRGEIASLAEFRDLLLPRLMSGKLRLTRASSVEEAV